MRNSKIREEAILEIWKSCEDSPEYKGLEPLELISEADGGRRRPVRRRVVFAVAELAVACIAGLCIFLAGSYSGSTVESNSFNMKMYRLIAAIAMAGLYVIAVVASCITRKTFQVEPDAYGSKGRAISRLLRTRIDHLL